MIKNKTDVKKYSRCVPVEYKPGTEKKIRVNTCLTQTKLKAIKKRYGTLAKGIDSIITD